MSSSNLIPDRVLIVDKRLEQDWTKKLEFIQLCHPRTKQEQSYTIDHQSKTIFEVIQCSRAHSCWFVDNQHVLPNGSLYLITPVNIVFLLLPSVWSNARTKDVSLKLIINDSFEKFNISDDFILEKLNSICDIDDETKLLKLNEDKLLKWFQDRIDRLKKHTNDEEHAFDLLCEYLPDEIVQYYQDKLKLHGNVRYEVPIGQKAMSITTKTVETTTTTTITTTKTKRCKK